MTCGKDIPKGFVETIRAEWTAERARLLREAIRRAIRETRRAGKTSRFKGRRYEAIRAEYAGRELPGGRRMRLSPSTFARLVQKARRGGRGAWGFLTFRHYHRATPDPITRAEREAWRAGERNRAAEIEAAKAARRQILESAAPADPAEAIRAGEAITGQKARNPEARRLAILALACAEIEARAAGGVLSVHESCKLAARQYGGAELGDGRRLRAARNTFWRLWRAWKAAGNDPEAMRHKWATGPQYARRSIPAAAVSACAAFAKRCGLTVEGAAREISRRFILPASPRTLRRYLDGRGLVKRRHRPAAPASKIEAELSKLAGILEPRPGATSEPPTP
jgi:hypothetical protein